MANGYQREADGTVILTDNVAVNVLPVPGPTERYYLTSLLVTNAHATVGTRVEIRSGTTVRKQGFACANGGGFALEDAENALFIGAPGEAITARCVTTGADVDVSITAKVF